jgi:hypothetical protein
MVASNLSQFLAIRRIEMAYVYFPARIALLDEHGLTGAKEVTIRVDDAVQATAALQQAAAIEQLDDFVAALDDVTDAQITGVTMTLPVNVVGLKSAPGEQGLAEGANLTMTTEDLEAVEHERPYWLPGAKEGVFLANFRTIDTGDTDLLAWVATFNDAPNGVAITISDKEQVLSIVEGSYATRRRNSSG